MQPGYKTPPAKESGKLALSQNNSPLPLFCQSSNVRSSHNVCNDNDKEDEGRSLYQEFWQENLIVSPYNNDNGEGTGSSSIRGKKCHNLAIASNTTPPVAVGSMSALIYQLAELEKERSSTWNGDGNGNVREMERLSNEFNEQADVLVAALQLSLTSSTSKNNAQAVSETDSNSNSDIGDVASIDIENPSSDGPDKDKADSSNDIKNPSSDGPDKDKADSSNVDISSNSKTSGLIFQLAETELAKCKARDISEIESLKKTFKRQAEAFISAFSGSSGKRQR